MNGTLLFILIAFACYVICVRLDPTQMRWWADFLNARADAEQWFKQRHVSYRRERAERERQLNDRHD
jgi:hypothetical protein